MSLYDRVGDRNSRNYTSIQCDEIDYEILGNDMQIVEIELDPNETVVAEAGSMNYLEEGITFKAKMGDGSNVDDSFMNQLFSAGKRMISGESLFMTHFENQGSRKRKVAFSAPYPGQIIPIDMGELGSDILCQKDAFLCAAKGTKIDIAFNRRLGTGLFGGEGFILERLSGDGLAFIQAGGTIIEKELRNETIRLDNDTHPLGHPHA
jgi:uncharacterized protein (AIM24 family)